MKNFSSVVVRENFASQQKGKKLSVSLSLFFLSHYTRPADDCVTSDRSVDELLMRSHFSTLHRRLSKRGRFPVCHQCSPLCYKAFFFAFSRFHTFSHLQAFSPRSLASRYGTCERNVRECVHEKFVSAQMEKYRIGVKKIVFERDSRVS